MTSSITIRPFEPKDLTESDQLLEVLKALTRVYELNLTQRLKIAAKLSQPPYYLFVAEENGILVGTTTLIAEQKIARGGGICGHIEDVAVLADKQGKGIGTLLLKAVIEKAKELDCYKLILDCSDPNVSYYEKFGFHRAENCMRLDL